MVTLWSIFPSPLMIGGELPSADDWTKSLLTNSEVLLVDQQSKGNHPAIATDSIVVWTAESQSGDADYLAVFNRTESPKEIEYAWSGVGLPGKSYMQRDLWERKDLGSKTSLSATLAAHSCVLYKLTLPPNSH